MGFTTQDALAMAQASGQILNAGYNYAAIAKDKEENERTREFTKEMYQRQVDDARENWRMQNEYNSPTAQMERLKAAGLNPNLIYGSGSGAASGNASSLAGQGTYHNVTPYQRPQNVFAGLASIAEGFAMAANIKKTQAEVGNIESHTALTQQQTLSEMIRRDGMNYANAKTREEAAIWKNKLEMDLKLYGRQINKLGAEIGLISSKTTTNDIFNSRYASRLDLQERGMLLSNRNSASDLLTKAFQRQYIMQQIEESVSRTLLNDSTRLNIHPAQVKSIAGDIALKSATLKGKDFENWANDYLKKNGIDPRKLGGGSLAQKLGLDRFYYLSEDLRNPY